MSCEHLDDRRIRMYVIDQQFISQNGAYTESEEYNMVTFNTYLY